MHRSHRDNWMSNHIGTPGDCQDQYAVWAPGLRDKCSTNDAFNLYAMECERQEQIEAFIHSLAHVSLTMSSTVSFGLNDIPLWW